MKNLGDHVNAMWQDVAKMEQVSDLSDKSSLILLLLFGIHELFGLPGGE